MQAFGNQGGYGNGGQGNGPPNQPPPGYYGAQTYAQAMKASKDFEKAYRMTFVKTRADADPLSFLFADEYYLIEQINGVTQQMVLVEDIRTMKASLRRQFAAMQYSKQELGMAMKYRRQGF